ncbi:MAG: hypothetical protein CVV49_11570 [Spirochaetae bacterium HGW-Spirochaetae-5]|nr:MAG: hypothetical protein CVV49_11570 [Spirochaetae bacterium HGW-Spirochaetae-5]
MTAAKCGEARLRRTLFRLCSRNKLRQSILPEAGITYLYFLFPFGKLNADCFATVSQIDGKIAGPEEDQKKIRRVKIAGEIVSKTFMSHIIDQ